MAVQLDEEEQLRRAMALSVSDAAGGGDALKDADPNDPLVQAAMQQLAEGQGGGSSSSGGDGDKKEDEAGRKRKGDDI